MKCKTDGIMQDEHHAQRYYSCCVKTSIDVPHLACIHKAFFCGARGGPYPLPLSRAASAKRLSPGKERSRAAAATLRSFLLCVFGLLKQD